MPFRTCWMMGQRATTSKEMDCDLYDMAEQYVISHVKTKANDISFVCIETEDNVRRVECLGTRQVPEGRYMAFMVIAVSPGEAEEEIASLARKEPN